MHFFSELCPFFDSDFYPLSSTPQPSSGTRMWCSCYNCRSAKTVTFCNISVITENIYLKQARFQYFCKCIKSFPNDKFWDSSKLKAFADDKLNAVVMMIPLFNRAENTVEKGENVG